MITIPWRGSVTDLATDCAALLTREQGEAFVRELERFLTLPHLSGKFRQAEVNGANNCTCYDDGVMCVTPPDCPSHGSKR